MHRKETKDGYLFNLPIIFFVIAFFVVPIVGTIVTSLFQDVTFLPKRFWGLTNYKQLGSDPYFWQSMRFTILFVVVSVALELVLGMIFALILNEKLRFRSLLRVAILIPWAIPIAISARIWQLIFNYSYGLFNFLAIQLGITTEPINWLGAPIAAFFALVISDVWKTVPFMTILLLTGLSAIPEVLYKQAMVDGSNFYQRFRYITLPLLKPVLTVALLFRTIDALRIFDLVYVLTGGGPGGSTNSLSLYAYNYFLTGDFGYGSAVSVVIFLIAFILAVIYIKVGRFSERIA
jgi:multiple sugar transport system permease protein